MVPWLCVKPAITIEDVQRAATRIADHVQKTPLLEPDDLQSPGAPRLWLKAECLQRGGAFKVRGAFNAVLAGLERGDRRDLLAVSSGNHAQAVALAARETGLKATIIMPEDSAPLKRAATARYGAEVIYRGITGLTREATARRLADERGLRLIHPFNDPEVMAGQGTLALELLDQVEALGGPPTAVLTPVGGGGLISGVAVVVKARWPTVRVIGVEPALADDAARSLAAGHIVALTETPNTIADGVRTLQIGEHTWSVIQPLVDEILTVSEEEILLATWQLWTRARLLAEPTGALPVAAMLTPRLAQHWTRDPTGKVVCVVSGGNADPVALAAGFGDARARDLAW
jgi:threonine dehydratase